MLINMSFKSTIMISADFFGLPNPVKLANYVKAAKYIFQPVINSLIICFASLAGIVFLSSLAGFAFGRLQFKGKKILYSSVVAVLMIPYAIMVLPSYQIVSAMGLINTKMALILPYIAGQQVLGIILTKTFYESLPEEMFEAARVDGASEYQIYSRIALPLSGPILITVGITSFVAMYNDYIWPTLVLTGGDDSKTFCQIVFNNAAGNGATDVGLLTASFILGALPLIVATLSCLKYYLQGMLEGAVKG
jgi:ABC-type glycerol-3-phosphate transport system permease component